MLRVLLLLVALALLARAEIYDPACKWQRSDCHECLLRHADDVDGNGKLDAHEVDKFKDKLLGWFGTALYKIAGAVTPASWLKSVSTPTIMERCGDHEGFITSESFKARSDHCLRNCEAWNHFMSLCVKLDKEYHHYSHHKIDKFGNTMTKKSKN